MPIKGLTDRGMAFPEIGQIRKGAKKTDPNKPGQDLKYFRVEFDEAETKRAKMFTDKYGAQPTEINILLPFNKIEQVWDAWYEAYTAGRMVARSDGEWIIYQLDTATGEVKVMGGEPKTKHPENGIAGYYTNGKGKQEAIKFKPTGRLKVVVPELQSLAYLTVMTTSIHDIVNISNQLEGIRQMNDGRIAGIPLVLRRRPKKISVPKPDGSRARMEKAMLSIEADPEWVKAKLVEMKRLALPGNGLALLPEGEHEPEHEIEVPADYAEDDEDEITEGEIEEAGEIEIEWDNQKVSMETASTLLSFSGQPYWLMDNQTLYANAAKIGERKAKNGLAPGQVEDLDYRMDVIDAILKYRAKAG